MRREVQPKFSVLAGVTVLSLAGSMLFAQDSVGGEPPPGAEVDTTQGITIVSPKPPRVTMEFRRADLVEVIHLIAKEAGANVVIDPGVKGEVTMRFTDVPWMRALSAVVKTSDYTLVEEDGGQVIRVADPAKLPIRTLDVERVQILLDVTSVTTSNEALIQMCVNWSSRIDRGITTGPGASDPNGDAAGQTSGRYPFHVGAASTGAPSSAAVAACLSEYDMRATLRLFAQDADTEFLMRPNVAVRPDAGARISIGLFVGEEIHYTGTPRDRRPHGGHETDSQTQESPPPPGVLEVTMGGHRGDASNADACLCLIPHLVVGTKEFILTVIPPDERLTLSASQVGGFEEFTAASGAALTRPWICKYRATDMTHHLIESGQTLVLAWPPPEGTRPTPRKFPYVGETSVLGQVFSRLAEKASKTRHFVFVGPHALRESASPR